MRKLRSDNLNESLKFNRFLSKSGPIAVLVISIDLLFFALFNFIVNFITGIPGASLLHPERLMYLGQILPKISEHGDFVRGLYKAFFFFIALCDAWIIYKIRVSFGEADVNKGYDGTSRWTTVDEIQSQYKEIPMKPSYIDRKTGAVITNYFDGSPGFLISRWKDRLYIDTHFSNSLVLGATGSGKGEMLVFPLIDIYSRARDISKRFSMVIFDPKVELYKSSKKTLEDRGYKVRLINLDNPSLSAGYNPLSLVVEYYKKGEEEKAEQMARSFAFPIFNSEENSLEPVWKNTATDLFTALIIAVISDCIEEDKKLNTKRRELYKKRRNQYEQLKSAGEIKALEQIDKVFMEFQSQIYDYEKELLLFETVEGIPGFYEYMDVFPNEKGANVFSVVNFFKEMVNRAASQSSKNPEGTEQIAQNLLDEYFNQRPPLDFAASLYRSIESAGAKMRGSIYTIMQSSLSIFSMKNMAALTAESDIDIEEIGFGKKPVAIFLGIPTEDKSNHFLAQSFVAQVFQYLFQIAKSKKGKVERKVKFIFDEFGNMPELYNFDNMVTNSRGADMSFDIIIQSYNQLYSKYGNTEKTIRDNFPNQLYILSEDTESAESFSKLLGRKTVVDIQRTGGRFSLNKTVMEGSKSRELLNQDELRHFREGECAISRGYHRRDIAGSSIVPYPILNEHLLELNLLDKIYCYFKTVKKRIIERNIGYTEDEKELTFQEEYTKAISDRRWFCGTAFLFRYQYMERDFPTPSTIEFSDVISESRAHIKYEKAVFHPEKVIEKIKVKKERRNDNNEKKYSFEELSEY